MNKKQINRIVSAMVVVACIFALSACAGNKDAGASKKVIIYSSAEDYRIEYFNKRLAERFPDYDIAYVYMTTGDLAAKLKAEGTKTECDIIGEMEYPYLDQLAEAGVLADLSSYDRSIYVEDTLGSKYYLPWYRNGGSIIVNPDVLAAKGLAEPTCYADLLDPGFADLVSMPSPKSSGTGYMFLKSLVNTWGEQEAFEYFDALTPNVLQYTSSGSGPVNALIQGEVAVGLGMTAQAVEKINAGCNLKILFFEEGSPFSLYGTSIIAGKETNPVVKEVYDFIANEITREDKELFVPEEVIKGLQTKLENYPSDIVYSDMSNNSFSEKERLLSLWKY